MSNLELESVIEDSVNDATASPDIDTSTDTAEVTPDASTDEVVAETSEVPGPGANAEEEVADEFASKFGLSSQSVTGRENRIPYSRVKKIVERAEKEAAARITKEMEGKFTPQTTELGAKVKDYEDRLTKVAQFEHILENDPKQFLDMLSKVPAYKEFFDYVRQAGGAAPAQQQAQSTLDSATMPQPDQTLSDGSKVYSMEGLNKRDEWLSKQIEDRAVKQAETRLSQRYAPMEQEWQAKQQRDKVIPIIQKQIADARTWPLFNENEDAILKALQADQTLSLEGAFRKVVHPLMQTSRDDMRKSILAELKNKPLATAAPTTASKPGQVAAGSRSLEDIIREAAQSLG